MQILERIFSFESVGIVYILSFMFVFRLEIAFSDCCRGSNVHRVGEEGGGGGGGGGGEGVGEGEKHVESCHGLWIRSFSQRTPVSSTT